MLSVIRQTLKDLLYMMENIDDEMIKNMEIAIDSFIDDASTYTKDEINEKFSSGEKAFNFLYEYIQKKAIAKNRSLHWIEGEPGITQQVEQTGRIDDIFRKGCKWLKLLSPLLTCWFGVYPMAKATWLATWPLHLLYGQGEWPPDRSTQTQIEKEN